jgi:aryl-alcohol dehydrogenase-like predicted oxidoreductase
MENVRLGRSDLSVSPIAFGTWQLGGEWGEFDEQQAIDAIRAARGLGINFFDTAQAYGFGKSEELLGRALRDELASNRDSLIIATKGGLRPEGDGIVRDSSPDWLRKGVDSSLEALGIDHIDLYQVHWPDPDTPFVETAGALSELKEAGKILHVGVSNFSGDELEELSKTLPVETLQPPYHLFRQDIEDDELPWCADHDVGVLVYGPLAHGLLTGAIDSQTEFAEDDWRSGSQLFEGDIRERNLEVVDQLKTFASERDVKLSQLAVAWTLAHPAVQVSIVGSRDAGHIEEAVEAASIELGQDDLEEIDLIMQGAVEARGPSPEGA